jgi:hypothetical protein
MLWTKPDFTGEETGHRAQEIGQQHGDAPPRISQIVDDEADALRAENKSLKEENIRLAAQVKTADEERARSVTQAYALRHDIARLRSELSTRALSEDKSRLEIARLTELNVGLQKEAARARRAETQQEQNEYEGSAQWGAEIQQLNELLGHSQAQVEAEKRRALHENKKLTAEHRKKMAEAGHAWLTKEAQLSKEIHALEDQVRALTMQVARMEAVEHQTQRQRLQEQQATPLPSGEKEASGLPARTTSTTTPVKETQETARTTSPTSPLGDNGLLVKNEGLIASLRNNVVGRFGSRNTSLQARPTDKLMKTRSEGSIPADESLMSGAIRAASHRRRKPAFEARIELEGDNVLSELP